MRNLKVMPEMAGSEPVTGLGVFQPQAALTWTPQGVSLGQLTYKDGETASTYGTGAGTLHRAGRS